MNYLSTTWWEALDTMAINSGCILIFIAYRETNNMVKVFFINIGAWFPEPCIVFFCHFEKKRLWRYNWTNMQGSGIAFNVSYIHSRTMYVVPIERAWKDNYNHELIVMIACKRFPSTYCLMQGRCFICSNFWTFYLKIIITALNK